MSSRSLNRVSLIGNLTRDPELRYTPQGTAVCTMTVATNRSWQPSDGGERKEETEFHRIVSWQKLAELCSQLLFKSRKVFVEGRLQTRRWTDQQGNERNTTEVVIDDMIVLDNRRREGGTSMGAPTSAPTSAPPRVPVNTQTGGASGMSAAMADDQYPEIQADDPPVGSDDQTEETSVKEAKSEDKKEKVKKVAEKKPKSKAKKAEKSEKPTEKDEEINPDDIPF